MGIDLWTLLTVFLLLAGWLIRYQCEDRPGVLLLIVTLWAIPMEVIFLTVFALIGEWPWEDWWRDIKMIPEVIRESYYD